MHQFSLSGSFSSDVRVTVGGGSDSLGVTAGVTGDLVLRMGGVSGDVIVDLGGGANNFTSMSSSLAKRLKVAAGGQNDFLQVVNSWMAGNARMDLGDNAITLQALDRDGDLLIKTGNGDDTVDFGTVNATGTIKIKHGGGNDTLPT